MRLTSYIHAVSAEWRRMLVLQPTIQYWRQARARGPSPNPKYRLSPPTVKHNVQKSGGELCETFKF